MNQNVFASLVNVPHFVAYFIVSLALLWLFKAVYVWVTPYKEIALIREGNRAAAVSLAGALMGFAIALASVVVHSINIVDLMIWGGVALIVQVLAYLTVYALIRDVAVQIGAGSVSHGIFLGALSLCAGILNGACITP